MTAALATPVPEAPRRNPRRASVVARPLEIAEPVALVLVPETVRDPRQSLLDTYLLEVRRHPLLSREQEHDIAVRYAETGDRKLATRLVTANLRLVVKIAFEYRIAHNNALDLVQEGNLGLLHAISKYDPHRGIKLSSYAVWWIRAFMLRFIMSSARLVKVGTTRAQRRLFFGLRKERARLERGGGPPVDVARLAKALNVRESDVVDMEARMAALDASLDTPRSDNDDGGRPYDQVAAETALRPDVQSESGELQRVLSAHLAVFSASLDRRDAEIFRRRLLSDVPVLASELAKKFGVSRERIRQLEVRLKNRLREHLRASMGDALPD